MLLYGREHSGGGKILNASGVVVGFLVGVDVGIKIGVATGCVVVVVVGRAGLGTGTRPQTAEQWTPESVDHHADLRNGYTASD